MKKEDALKTFIFETRFLPRHFLHLTGVILNNRSNPNSANFYSQCLNGRLSINDFSLSDNGQTEKKLQVLPQLMDIHKTAKIVGDFNMSGIFLSTDKLAGGTFGCLGFVQSGKYYSPNTALNRDIRQIVSTPNKVLAILRKPINQENYTELCCAAKGIHLDKIKLPSDISDKIDILIFHQNDGQASKDRSPCSPTTEAII